MIKVSLRSLVIGAAFSAGLIATAGTAQAIEYNFGDVKMNIDTTASIGVGMRTSGQDCSHINTANGGCLAAQGTNMGVNDDDGNVNTDRGELYSSVVKVTSEVQATYKNYGAFVRVKAFYDYWVDQQLSNDTGRFGRRPIEDANRGDGARNFGSRGINLLDAFAYGNFDVGNLPLTVRVGSQVINWGESLAIAGGISSYLPVDVSALRTPGAELKEAYQPVPAIYVSLGLPNNFSVEAFWQAQWKRTRLDACGTFFAGSDGYCEGGAYIMSAGEYPTAPIYIPMVASDEGDDTGTFGVSLKYYADWLNDGTDTGLYFVQYSSALPVGTFTAGYSAAAFAGLDAALGGGGTITDITSLCAAFGTASFPACATTPQAALGGVSPIQAAIVTVANTKTSHAQYASDIQTLGASFNTVVPILGGTAFSGETSYTHDMPFQLSDVEINCADLINTGAGSNPALGWAAACRPDAPTVADGQTIRGYDRFNVWAGQFSLISTLPTSNALTNLIGSDIVVLVANAGFQYIPGLNGSNNRLGAPRASTTNPNPIVGAILGDAACATGTCPLLYADDFSWGYRLIASTDYNNAFGTAWTLSPNVSFGHDVYGTSAGPIGPGFVEGKKAITVGVGARLQSALRASVGYTHNWGNAYRNFSSDKDFATATVSYAF
tara:strand:- start:543 stop:2531 length:1989 start_codon:yes stop_codon:yes gene_type:complete